jgi:hypothetical protein
MILGLFKLLSKLSGLLLHLHLFLAKFFHLCMVLLHVGHGLLLCLHLLLLSCELLLKTVLIGLHLAQLSLSSFSFFLQIFLLLLVLLHHLVVLISSFWLEGGAEENFSCRLVVKHDCEPVFDSAVDHQRRHLDLRETDCVGGSKILVPASKSHFICWARHFQLKLIIPLGGLSGVVVDLGLELVFAESNRAVR